MTTASYPLSSTNFPSSQWRSVFVASDGSASTSLDLTLSSVSDAATVGLGKVWYRGYVLEATVAHALTLAAVTGSAKTYSVGVMFDPANEATNPLALYSALKTAITIPSGGSFHTLWEVTRQPSQTLNLATVADFRTYLGPRLWVPGANLPTDAALGTVAYDGANEWIRVRNSAKTGAQWNSVSNPAWTPITVSATWTPGSTAPAARVVGGRLEFSGSATKAAAPVFTAGVVTLGTVSAAGVPAHFTRIPASAGGILADLEIYGADSGTPGRVDAHFYTAGANAINISGCSMAVR
jgi:hypothetical protein